MITPLTLVLLIGFFISFGVVSDPDGTLAKVSSFIPPIAPTDDAAADRARRGERGRDRRRVRGDDRRDAALIPLAARIYSGAVLRDGRHDQAARRLARRRA